MGGHCLLVRLGFWALVPTVAALAPVVLHADDENAEPRWSGEIAIGAVAYTGNQSTTQGDADATVRHFSGPWEAELNASGSYGRAEGATIARRFYARLKMRRDLTDTLYGFGLADYENDRFGGYRRVLTQSAGLGWRLVETESFQLDGEAGPAFRQARRRSDGRLESATMLRLAVDMVWAISPTATFTNETVLLLSHDRVEVAAGAGLRRDALETRNISALTMPIVGDIAGRVSVELRYNSSPPPDAASLDTRTRLGVVYAF